MDIFEKAIEFVLKHEGGYVFDPHDPGGETNFGISKKAYPNLNIKELTEKQAKAIYRRDYWEKIRGDDLPKIVAFALLDTAVNCGVFKASMWLQLSLNLICKKGLKIDGIIGPKTLGALEECSKQRIAMYLLHLRLEHYLSLKNDRYFRGWVGRVSDLMKEIAKLGGVEMQKQDLEKIKNILKIVDELVLPLAKKGAEMTENPLDDIAVAFLEGGVPGAKQRIEEMTNQEQK